ncbi:hypothetical protein [Devosia sp. Naph2]|uniref:hypothetical protein n=1 Tax=Devosia polycyclovorans TaxID=3345148 RepID=UPI0035D132F1
MRFFLLLVLLGISSPTLANHPGEQLNEVMAAKEDAFEAVDGPVPKLALRTAEGGELDLGAFADKIVVLSFVPEECGSACAEQQQLLVQVQEDINVGPMQNMVTFVTVADSARANPQQWDTVNWIAAIAAGELVGQQANRMAKISARDRQAPMVHVLARGGRQAAVFHGAEFRPMNMLLYVNGLTNARIHKVSWLDWLLGWVS